MTLSINSNRKNHPDPVIPKKFNTLPSKSNPEI